MEDFAKWVEKHPKAKYIPVMQDEYGYYRDCFSGLFFRIGEPERLTYRGLKLVIRNKKVV